MAANRFVVLQWKDGWREVVAVEPDAASLRRYFVIERTEYFGRLVLERGETEYPGLVVIDRKPMDVERVALVDGGAVESALTAASVYEEGDRREHNFELTAGGHQLLDVIAEEIDGAARSRNLSRESLMAKPETERKQILSDLAREIRVVGGKAHEDAVDFLEGILQQIPAARP